MPRSISIVTPENVKIDYELAGIASRAGAAVLDLFLQGLLILIIFGVQAVLRHYGKWTGAIWAKALLGIVSFVIFWGYYVFFETIWNGQTPGKRAARLRTIKEEGSPIDISSAGIRNLIRIVDMVPFLIPYLLGGICVFASGSNKRLGDIAAGTVVVKERGELLHTQKQTPQPQAVIRYPEAAYVKNIELIKPEEFAAIKRFIDRKAELPQNLRNELAAKIARPLMNSLGIKDSPHINYSNLLTELYNGCVEERGMR